MAVDVDFAERIASCRRVGCAAPAVYRPSKRAPRDGYKVTSSRTGPSPGCGALKTIGKSRTTAYVRSTKLKRKSSQRDQLAWQLLRIARGTAHEHYDFKCAVAKREHRLLDITDQMRSDWEVLRNEHNWTEPYVALNVLADVRDLEKAREILSKAEMENRELFGRGNVVLKSEAPSGEVRRAAGVATAVETADPKQENSGLRPPRLVSDYSLAQTRDKLQKALTRLTTHQSSVERATNTSSANSLGERAKEEKNVRNLRDQLRSDILRSNSLERRGEIDLHGLAVQDALQVVVAALHQTRFKEHLTVIHGKGKHSKAKVSMIAVSLTRFLADAGIDFEPVEHNRGRLIIRPDRSVPLNALLARQMSRL